ncbi:YdcF family protein [Anaerovibrio sp.]|uniref:YdcF family protein n=1 Tax=Anaerovibrio sp. TaxID=1872532 RepID=UPI003F155D73
MIYLLKFGASFVLPPGIFFVCFWLLALYLWRRREIRAAAALLAVSGVFYLLSTGLVSSVLMGSLERAYDQPAEPAGDVIIMLGGGATADTPNMGELGNLCASPASRLLAAAELYGRLHVPVLVSGGQVYEDSGPEAVIARRELMRLGVPEQDILLEPDSLNTRQNAAFSGRLLRERGLSHPVLVTSAFHMERSVLNFEKEGFQVTAYPTDFRTGRRQSFHYNKLMPSTGALEDSVIVMREKLRSMVTRYLE